MFETLDTFSLVVVFISLVISISIHEAMHAFTSHWLGDDTAEREGRITLNPLKHVDVFGTVILPIVTLILFRVPLLAAKPVPFNPNRVRFEEFGAALVGLVGPFTNFVLAAAGAGLVHIFQGSLGVDALQALVIFVSVNIGLFVFNMIPIPPLDGSRALYALAPESVQRFMASLEMVGIFIVFAMVVMVPEFREVLLNINNSVFEFLL